MGAPAATDNVALTGSITAQTTATVNTINLGANSITMSAARQILNTNGLLSSGSTTATLGLANAGGVLQPVAAGNEMVIRVNGSTDKLTLNALIQNFAAGGTASSLTKTGAGTLVLGDSSTNVNNTYSGGTFLNAGTVQLGDTNTGSGSRTWFGTGLLTIADGAAITSISDPTKVVANAVTLSGGYANLTSRDTQFSGKISGPGGVAVIPAGRWLLLNNSANDFTGGIVMRGNGSFTYDGGEQYGPGKTDDNTYYGKSGYYGMSPTATYVLTYSLPLRKTVHHRQGREARERAERGGCGGRDCLRAVRYVAGENEREGAGGGVWRLVAHRARLGGGGTAQASRGEGDGAATHRAGGRQ